MTLTISKALAMTAFRVVQDDVFFRRVSSSDSNCCSALSCLCPGMSSWLICTCTFRCERLSNRRLQPDHDHSISSPLRGDYNTVLTSQSTRVYKQDV